MNAVSLQKAVNILPDLVHKTIMNCEETVIVSDDGAVVLVEQREWESILETVRLLQDKISLKALLDGHKTRDTGDSLKSVTVQEAFYDLQGEVT